MSNSKQKFWLLEEKRQILWEEENHGVDVAYRMYFLLTACIVLEKANEWLHKKLSRFVEKGEGDCAKPFF
ncbi:MAG TPA: hypothetical protein PLD12_11440 [Bacteroidales bacterium]|nr:hypothetical protein [Bacteroidales bacterium]HPO65980.1 hypothetical protein [Bacteroidales bacterium]